MWKAFRSVFQVMEQDEAMSSLFWYARSRNAFSHTASSSPFFR